MDGIGFDTGGWLRNGSVRGFRGAGGRAFAGLAMENVLVEMNSEHGIEVGDDLNALPSRLSGVRKAAKTEHRG